MVEVDLKDDFDIFKYILYFLKKCILIGDCSSAWKFEGLI